MFRKFNENKKTENKMAIIQRCEGFENKTKIKMCVLSSRNWRLAALRFMKLLWLIYSGVTVLCSRARGIHFNEGHFNFLIHLTCEWHTYIRSIGSCFVQFRKMTTYQREPDSSRNFPSASIIGWKFGFESISAYTPLTRSSGVFVAKKTRKKNEKNI